jgi:hypothetical protein
VHLRINEGLKKIAASRIYNLKKRLLFDVNFINSLSIGDYLKKKTEKIYAKINLTLKVSNIVYC